MIRQDPHHTANHPHVHAHRVRLQCPGDRDGGFAVHRVLCELVLQRQAPKGRGVDVRREVWPYSLEELRDVTADIATYPHRLGTDADALARMNAVLGDSGGRRGTRL